MIAEGRGLEPVDLQYADPLESEENSDSDHNLADRRHGGRRGNSSRGAGRWRRKYRLAPFKALVCCMKCCLVACAANSSTCEETCTDCCDLCKNNTGMTGTAAGRSLPNEDRNYIHMIMGGMERGEDEGIHSHQDGMVSHEDERRSDEVEGEGIQHEDQDGMVSHESGSDEDEMVMGRDEDERGSDEVEALKMN